MARSLNGLNTFGMQEAVNANLGIRGFQPLTGPGSVSGSYIGFLVLEDVVTAANTTTERMGTIPGGVTITAGTYVPGPFTSIDITSGKLLAYHV